MSSTILVVEDEERIRQFLQRGLGFEGYRVEAAADGTTALEIARDNPPDLVVLDLMLPGIDGLEVCRRIRALPDGASRVPVLMLTAKGDPMDRIIGLELGADDYLPKPFEPRELLARIRAVLRRQQPWRPSPNTVCCASARWRSTATPAPSASAASRPNSPATSSTCW